MKLYLMMSVLFAAPLSFAQNASDCRIHLDTHAGGMSALVSFEEGTPGFTRVKRILEKKGYQVTDAGDAPYSLKVVAGAGYGCGTGLTLKDYWIIPSAAYLTFTGQGEPIEREYSKRAIPIAAAIEAKRQAIRWVKDLIPECR